MFMECQKVLWGDVLSYKIYFHIPIFQKISKEAYVGVSDYKTNLTYSLRPTAYSSMLKSVVAVQVHHNRLANMLSSQCYHILD